MDKAATSPASSVSNDKVLAAVSTIPLVGLIIYFAMPDASAYVKNYAKQGMVYGVASFVVYVAFVVVNVVLSYLPFGGILGCLTTILGCFLPLLLLIPWLILLIKALQGEEAYRLPMVADLADSIFKK